MNQQNRRGIAPAIGQTVIDPPALFEYLAVPPVAMLQIRPEQLTEIYRQRALPRRQGCILEMTGAWHALSPRWEDRFVRPQPSDEDRHAFFVHVFDRCAESGVEDKNVVIGAAIILLRAAQQGWHSHEIRHGLFLVCGSDDPAMHLQLLEHQVAGPAA